jgi:hypothetical protein
MQETTKEIQAARKKMQGTIEWGYRKPGRRCKGLERGCWQLGIDARDYIGDAGSQEDDARD